MRVRFLLPPALMLGTLVFAGCATAPAEVAQAPAESPRVPLRGADCLAPASVRDFQYVDSSQLVVDAGRRKYRIRLSEFCTHLATADRVSFQGDALSGRVCGNIGERLILPRMQCRIDRVELIDEHTYREATGDNRGSVSATAPVQ